MISNGRRHAKKTVSCLCVEIKEALLTWQIKGHAPKLDSRFAAQHNSLVLLVCHLLIRIKFEKS